MMPDTKLQPSLQQAKSPLTSEPVDGSCYRFTQDKQKPVQQKGATRREITVGTVVQGLQPSAFGSA
jgi:hypothetical protein